MHSLLAFSRAGASITASGSNPLPHFWPFSYDGARTRLLHGNSQAHGWQWRNSGTGIFLPLGAACQSRPYRSISPLHLLMSLPKRFTAMAQDTGNPVSRRLHRATSRCWRDSAAQRLGRFTPMSDSTTSTKLLVHFDANLGQENRGLKRASESRMPQWSTYGPRSGNALYLQPPFRDRQHQEMFGKCEKRDTWGEIRLTLSNRNSEISRHHHHALPAFLTLALLVSDPTQTSTPP